MQQRADSLHIPLREIRDDGSKIVAGPGLIAEKSMIWQTKTYAQNELDENNVNF